MRQNEANKDIRRAAQGAGVYLWQVAEVLGISDRTFCVWMRRELSPVMKKRAMQAIARLSGGKKKCDGC